MQVSTEKQINSGVARVLREKSGKNQKEFWGSVGVTQSGGCRYEGGGKIPAPVRKLLFIFYVAALNIDTTSAEGAAAAIELGKLQASIKAKEKVRLGERIQKVMHHLRSAHEELQQV